MIHESNNPDKKDKIIIDLDDAEAKAVSKTYSLYTSFEVETTHKEVPQISDEEVIKNISETAKSFKPNVQKNLKKVMENVPLDLVKKVANPTEEQKNRLFGKEQGNFDKNLSKEEQEMIKEKMESWKVSNEVSQVNSAVSVNWLSQMMKNPPKTNE